MNKTLATLGILGLAEGLSLCDRCSSGTRSTTALPAAVVAFAAPVQAPAPASAPSQAPVAKIVTLKVQGMTCGGCVIGTRKVLTRLAGVTKADVSYEKGTAVVTYDPTRVTVEQMVAAIKTLGYTAIPAAS